MLKNVDPWQRKEDESGEKLGKGVKLLE